MFHDTEKWCKNWTKSDLWFGKWQEEFGKFLRQHSKVSKVELWLGPFIQSRKRMSLKFTEELCVMTMNNDTKFDEGLAGPFKIYMRNLVSFYVSWHSKVMQNVKKKWLALSKVRWGNFYGLENSNFI